MTIQLWTWGTPNGWKVTIMLEELIEAGVDLPDVDVRPVDLLQGEQFKPAFTTVAPNNKIPAIVHDGRALMESCAILTYLGETYPTSLLPLDARKWDVLQWVWWQAANLGPVFGNKLSYTRYMADVPDAQKAHPLRRFGNEAQRLLAVLSKQLGDSPFVCGEDFTIADIAIYPWVRGWKWSKVDITGHRNIMDWVDRVRARPAVERGLRYGIAEEEVDQWSADTKKRYAALGSSMTSNAHGC